MRFVAVLPFFSFLSPREACQKKRKDPSPPTPLARGASPGKGGGKTYRNNGYAPIYGGVNGYCVFYFFYITLEDLKNRRRINYMLRTIYKTNEMTGAPRCPHVSQLRTQPSDGGTAPRQNKNDVSFRVLLQPRAQKSRKCWIHNQPASLPNNSGFAS